MFVTPAYAQAAGGAGAAFTSFVPLILIFAIMYFLLIRPQQKKLKDLQQRLGVTIQPKEPQTRLHKCPACKTGTMITIEVFGKRGPPAKYLLVTENIACN